MMKLLKILFRWWIDGWKIFIYYSAFYIFTSLLLGIPVYLWNKKIISGRYDTILAVIYFVFYLPIVFRFAATYLGKFPAQSSKKDNLEEHASTVDTNSEERV